MLTVQFLDQTTSEDAIAGMVDAVKQAPEQRNLLLSLLPERSALYAGRSTNATMRIRGYILAAFEEVGLPEAALPYVLEELESGREAYLVAAAARALRGLPAPREEFVPYLLAAVENIKYWDDAVTFETLRPQWPLHSYTSALAEIFRSVAWLGAAGQSALADLQAMVDDRESFADAIRQEIKRAIDAIQAVEPAIHDCCAPAQRSGPTLKIDVPASGDAVPVAGLEFEDQAGNPLTYGDFFSQLPAVVVFFYTRCTNPNKCSRTITKLGQLQRLVRSRGLQGRLKTAAITYDPEYDLPARLEAYGRQRGVAFDAHNRFLRARGGMQALQDYFELGVNYNGSLVNRHRIELFILDGGGRIVETFARLQWDAEAVLERLPLAGL